jgi:serine/threonine protein kinase
MIDTAVFALLDPDFFASHEQRQPGMEYRPLVAELESQSWSVLPGGVWTHVVPPQWTSPAQGWKIHLSATPSNARTVLRKVAQLLEAWPAAFKFASDEVMLFTMTSKNWPREGGGKFITIYPPDEAHFRHLVPLLVQATEGLEGPYILSDRRVPGSRVVFYRYGEHTAAEGVDAWGRRVQAIQAPDGGRVSDERKGWYQLPDWVADPYGARAVPVLEGGRKVTLNGRFEVEGAIKYSNLGGIYRALDPQTDQRVIVRERRPFTGWVDDRTDGVAMLEKESRILRKMEGTGWAPGFVEEFQVWEHRYLAMEEVRGTPLREYALSRLVGRRGIGSPRALFTSFRRVILDLVAAVEEYHRRGIILRDLTAGNVLVRPDRSVCIIDFEFAWERDGDQPWAPGIHTPGAASPQQMAGQPPTEADDFHAIGAIIVEMCSMMTPGLGLNRDGVLAAAEMMMDEVGLPRELLIAGRGLTDPDPATRWTGDAVRRALAGVRPSDLPWKPRLPGRNGPLPSPREEREVLARVSAAGEELCAFFEAAAGGQDAERLWPVSPEAFSSNAVCIQFGACGPIEYVRRAHGSSPEAWLDWVERAAVPGRIPPGMYVGLAGIALTLAAGGRKGAARRLLLEAAESPLLKSTSGLYQGAAGVGVAALSLADALDEPALRDVAVELGVGLRERAQERRQGLAWSAKEVIPCGLAGGAAGISLFYTYLGATTGERSWWEVARRALDFDLAQASRRGEYTFWPSTARPRRIFRSPHVFFGSAGIATAAIRLHACTGDPELLDRARTAAGTLTFRWTNKLWQDFGYAGWGETLLDMHAATGEHSYRQQAVRLAQVLLPMRVRTRFGTAFPGGGLNRVASDFGMGASGIGVFLHRLTTPGTHRAFYPDHLIPGWGAPKEAPAAGVTVPVRLPLAQRELATV